MRFIAPLLIALSLLAFTAPNGATLWIERGQVVAVTAPTSCDKGASAKIITLSGALCVYEGVDEAVRRLEGADGVGSSVRGVSGD